MTNCFLTCFLAGETWGDSVHHVLHCWSIMITFSSVGHLMIMRKAITIVELGAYFVDSMVLFDIVVINVRFGKGI